MFTTNLEDLLALTSQLEEKSKVVKTEISQARERMEAEKAIWEKEKEEMANRYKIDDVLITLNVCNVDCCIFSPTGGREGISNVQECAHFSGGKYVGCYVQWPSPFYKGWPREILHRQERRGKPYPKGFV
jgi:hypothetical protein